MPSLYTLISVLKQRFNNHLAETNPHAQYALETDVSKIKDQLAYIRKQLAALDADLHVTPDDIEMDDSIKNTER